MSEGFTSQSPKIAHEASVKMAHRTIYLLGLNEPALPCHSSCSLAGIILDVRNLTQIYCAGPHGTKCDSPLSDTRLRSNDDVALFSQYLPVVAISPGIGPIDESDDTRDLRKPLDTKEIAYPLSEVSKAYLMCGLGP